jgi:predicted metal-dependent phosphoesterase TrpH
VLRQVRSSYAHQIAAAEVRRDTVSLNHRVAALLASYFDVLFALNRVLHPGEKRLVEYAERTCAERPDHMGDDVLQENPRYGGALELMHALWHQEHVPSWDSAARVVTAEWHHVRPCCATIEEVIATIHAAGGVAVLTHLIADALHLHLTTVYGHLKRLRAQGIIE